MDWDLGLSVVALVFVLLSLFGEGKSIVFQMLGGLLLCAIGTYAFIAQIKNWQVDPGLLTPTAILGTIGWANLMRYGRTTPKRTASGTFAPRNSQE